MIERHSRANTAARHTGKLRVAARVTRDTANRLTVLAKRNGVTRGELCRRIIAEAASDGTESREPENPWALFPWGKAWLRRGGAEFVREQGFEPVVERNGEQTEVLARNLAGQAVLCDVRGWLLLSNRAARKTVADWELDQDAVLTKEPAFFPWSRRLLANGRQCTRTP